jgi:hypothetical protein
MDAPPTHAGQIADKTDQQLIDMLLAKPTSWTPEALDAAREELKRRSLEKLDKQTDQQLMDMLARPALWTPEAIAAANAELKKRRVAFSAATPQVSQEGASAIGNPLNQAAPLVITLISDSGTRRYAQPTPDATLSALRADILQGAIPREAKTTIKGKKQDGTFYTWDGPLLKLALQYSQLATIYFPVRQHSFAGMGYGTLSGVFIWIGLFGFHLYQVNQMFGAMMMALPVCWVVQIFLTKRYELQVYVNPGALVSLLLLFALIGKGFFWILLIAALEGGVLFIMPGMAVGAAVGVIRRSHLELAKDAPKENVALRIAIPLIIGTAIWIALFVWVQSSLPTMSK